MSLRFLHLPFGVAAVLLLVLWAGCSPSPSKKAVDVGSDAAVESCGELALEACASHPKCAPLFARPYDLAQRCAKAREDFGCVTISSCEDGETAALDEFGRCWLFERRCPPSPFGAVEMEMEPSACSALMLAWPDCPEAPVSEELDAGDAGDADKP